MKLAWFNTQDLEKDYLKEKDLDIDIDFFDEPLEEASQAEDYDGISIFLTSEIDREMAEDLDVEFIACRSTGVDHVDLDTAAKHDIRVCNVPNYGAVTVAEHVFSLMLSLSRKTYYGIEKVKRGGFDREGLRGFDLSGKTLGVIGSGSIGKEVIKRGLCFGMDVIAYDPYPDRDTERLLGYDYVDLDQLLEESDIISLHSPLTEETEHMLSAEEFDKMDGTVIINTARGKLIDTDALVKALNNGKVSMAGLDVLEEEETINEDLEVLADAEGEGRFKTLLANHRLLRREDVLITPHNAFNSVEAHERIIDTTVENIKGCKNVVN